jgi:hypothetical protein
MRIVHTIRNLIERAGAIADGWRVTASVVFLRWRIRSWARRSRAAEIDVLMRCLRYVDSGGRRYSGDELNER